jgi:hypothetical protein
MRDVDFRERVSGVRGGLRVLLENRIYWSSRTVSLLRFDL